MNLKAVIFGVNGQDGYYLSELLNSHEFEVFGYSRSMNPTGDVGNFDLVNKIIKELTPQYIFHLAANSTTKHDAVFENHHAISTGTINILESVRRHSKHSVVFLSGSAMQFKNIGNPIFENTPFMASSSYAVSRIQSTYTARYYRNKFGLKVFIGYLFNHDSPFRSEKHINQKIVLTVRRIANGSNEKLEIGDIQVRKEFNFAGDIVKAIWTLVNQSRVYEAVIGCGKAYSIEEWVRCNFEYAGLNWRDHVNTISNYQSEYDVLVSNPQLIKSLGWQPKVNFYQLADIMMNA